LICTHIRAEFSADFFVFMWRSFRAESEKGRDDVCSSLPFFYFDERSDGMSASESFAKLAERIITRVHIEEGLGENIH